MAAKLKHYTVSVEKLSIYEVEIEATSEDKAAKAAERMVREEDVEPDEENIEATDIYETEFNDE